MTTYHKQPRFIPVAYFTLPRHMHLVIDTHDRRVVGEFSFAFEAIEDSSERNAHEQTELDI